MIRRRRCRYCAPPRVSSRKPERFQWTGRIRSTSRISRFRFRSRPGASGRGFPGGRGMWRRRRWAPPTRPRRRRRTAPPLSLRLFGRTRFTIQSGSPAQKSRRPRNRRRKPTPTAVRFRVVGVRTVRCRRRRSGGPDRWARKHCATLAASGSSRAGSFPSIDRLLARLIPRSCIRIATGKFWRCGRRRRWWSRSNRSRSRMQFRVSEV